MVTACFSYVCAVLHRKTPYGRINKLIGEHDFIQKGSLGLFFLNNLYLVRSHFRTMNKESWELIDTLRPVTFNIHQDHVLTQINLK